MIWKHIAITGIGSSIEQQIDCAELLARGQLSPEIVEDGYQSIAVASPGVTPGMLALRASKKACANAGFDPKDLDLVVYASTSFKDKSFWSAAAGVCEGLGAAHAQFIDVFQGCNGAIAALELAAQKMHCHPELEASLVVCAEAFPAPFFDRFTMDRHGSYGDGAGALLLQRTPLAQGHQVLTLQFTYCAWLNDLIQMPFGSHAEFASDRPRSELTTLLPGKEAFMQKRSSKEIGAHFTATSRQLIDRSCQGIGLTPAELDYVIFPAIGWPLFQNQLGSYNFPLEKTNWSIARTLGHIGCVDPVINLDMALDQGLIHSGERVALVTLGAGYSFSVTVVQIA